ncbi:hypothetical protein J1605_014135 [Eschrichtius robustus]|uniref:Uncharacterized protein n=1 Tax=Eschrichtius robustus TaxID=9764 RepID=A0AB34GFI3_ESCRO|nr:hypothetical protein J1605_014135 [Eschrichtius robustus]
MSCLCADGSPSSASLSLGHCESSQRSRACQAVSPVKAAVSLRPAQWLRVWTVQPDHGSTQEIGQEPVHGAPCSVSLQEGREPPTSTRAHGRLRGENVSTGDRNETCMVWRVQAGRLEKLVGNLVPAFLGGDPSDLPTFLGSYRAFPTTQQMLELPFTRYGCILPYSDEDGGPLPQLKIQGPDPSSPEEREPPSLLGSGAAATGRRVRTPGRGHEGGR